MSKFIEFNIGLNNSPFDAEEMTRRVHGSPPCHNFIKGKVVDGEWDEVYEPTLYLQLNCNYSRISTIIGWVEDLCTMFKQDAIAVRIDGIGYLVYNYTRPDVERIAFDSNYFKTWS